MFVRENMGKESESAADWKQEGLLAPEQEILPQKNHEEQEIQLHWVLGCAGDSGQIVACLKQL